MVSLFYYTTCFTRLPPKEGSSAKALVKRYTPTKAAPCLCEHSEAIQEMTYNSFDKLAARKARMYKPRTESFLTVCDILWIASLHSQ